MASRPSIRRPAILLGGASRVGKTRLATYLVELAGFDVIHCDDFRKTFWCIADEQKRSLERYRHYEEAIARRRNGLVVEGDDLIGRNRGNVLAGPGTITDHVQPTLSLLLHLMKQPEVKAFIVGFIDPNLDRVSAAIRRHAPEGRRTRTYSDADLTDYVLACARISKALRSMAGEARIPFIELTGDDSDSAIEAAARRILRDVGWPLPASSGVRRPTISRPLHNGCEPEHSG